MLYEQKGVSPYSIHIYLHPYSSLVANSQLKITTIVPFQQHRTRASYLADQHTAQTHCLLEVPTTSTFLLAYHHLECQEADT